MIVAVIGKGGVGKTTVASLLLRRLLESEPDSRAGHRRRPFQLPGPGARRRRRRRRWPTCAKSCGRTAGRPPCPSAEWLALRAEEAMVESPGFDLLTMGRPEGKGCYCYVNNLIRDHLDRLSRAYRHVLLDCEAGLEHLSRRTSGRPDVLVCVANRSRMGARDHPAVARSVCGPARRASAAGRPGAQPVRGRRTAGGRDGGHGSRRGRLVHQGLHVLPKDPQVAAFESAREIAAGTESFAARPWRRFAHGRSGA